MLNRAEAKVIEIGNVKFRVKALPPDKALKGLSAICEKILPAFGGLLEQLTKAPQASLSTLETSKVAEQFAKACATLPEMYELFLGVSEYYRELPAGWASLSTFGEYVFARRPTLILAWLSACILEEYGDFFTEDGRLLMGETVNRWISLISLIGGSGGSSQTNESPTG